MNALLAVLLASQFAVTALDKKLDSPSAPTPATSATEAAPEAGATPAAPATAEPVPRGTTFKQERDIHADLLIISGPEKEILPLLPDLRNPKTINGAQERLLDLAAAGKVTLQNWVDVTTQNGTRAVSENITEFRYPIEFDLPDHPAEKESATGAAGKERLALQPVGTTFETRNTGATLDVEPVLGSGGDIVQITHLSQWVHFDGNLEYYAGENIKGEATKITQPEFSTAKANGTIQFKSGERRLILAQKPKPVSEDTWTIMILGAEILPAKGR